MDKEIKMTPAQLSALDEIINAVNGGELAPDDLESFVSPALEAAPVNNNNNGGGQNLIQRIVGGIGAGGIGLTVTITIMFGARVQAGMSLSEIEEVKKEVTLERLIEIRDAAIANNNDK